MRPIVSILKRSVIFFAILLFSVNSVSLSAQRVGALEDNLILASNAENAFPIFDGKVMPVIVYDAAENPAIIRAIHDLQKDMFAIFGVKPLLSTTSSASRNEIIVGSYTSRLVLGQKENSELKGKWERFYIKSIKNTQQKNKLIIAGSDKRGTIYGIYELSRQLGVSPWYWWADVPIIKKDRAYVKSGSYLSEEPKVKYRGIFINDEEPAFGTWARTKFGGVNSAMYQHLFELMLRLRANYLWPAMWGKAFNEDDSLNPKIANDYGIVMGTSHHEPMMRAQKEWGLHHKNYGNGEWNFHTNAAGLKQFWVDGFTRNKDYDNIVTIGLRGDGDEPMKDIGDAKANFRILEDVMTAQRDIIKKISQKPIEKTPQVWALYSEVLEYFDQGIHVPDDVMILLCDDNWGDVRRLPTSNVAKHPGGYGMYYHVDLHGAPRAYQWLNMTQIQHMWEQLQLTASYGVDKIWILNVGDLKANEFPMDFFLNMAWNPSNFHADNLLRYTQNFCRQQLGDASAKEAADILNLLCKYNARVTAEMLNDTTYNLPSGEFEKANLSFQSLKARALELFLQIPEEYQNTYQELILHPVKAMANLYQMYYAVAMNKKYYQEHDARANDWADIVDSCFAKDKIYTNQYNLQMANGKWNHMMDQTHIGYTSWDEPKGGNIKPVVFRVKKDDIYSGGYLFQEKNGVVVMEAEHFYAVQSSQATKWTVIPDLGRTVSGLTQLPYNQPVVGSSASYKFQLQKPTSESAVHLFFSTTLPFNKSGLQFSVVMDGQKVSTINLNQDLNWSNNYSKMYPAAAARQIEKIIKLPIDNNKNELHTLQFLPLDPAIVLEKIVIDNGGYKKLFLGGEESSYQRIVR